MKTIWIGPNGVVFLNSDLLFEKILAQSSFICLATGVDDRVFYVSPLMCEILGMQKEQLIGKTWEEMGCGSDLASLMNVNMGLAKDNKTVTTVEIGQQHIPGDRVYECRISPILNEAGELECLLATLTDITTQEEIARVNNYMDQIVSKLQSSSDIDNAIPKVLSDITAAFDADISTILFRQDEHWYPKYSFGVNKTTKDNIYLEEQPALAQLVQKAKDIYTLNYGHDGGYFAKKMVDAWGIKSMVAIPLHIQGEIFGILTMAYRTSSKGFCGSQRDGLKRIASMLSLAFSEDRYIWSREGEVSHSKKYLEMLNVGLALLDGKDGTVKWSNAIYNSVVPVKYRGINITKMSYYHVSADVAEAEPKRMFEDIVVSGSPLVYGCIMERNQSGVLKYWQVAFIPTPSKKHVPDVLSLVVDITELENTNKKNARLIHAIQQEQYRVRTLLDALPVGVYISDAEGQILDISRRGSKIWGEDAHLPRSVEEYGEYDGFWPDTGERLKVDDWPLAKAVKRGETTIGEVIDFHSFDGRSGTIINSAAPIRNRHGRVVGAVEIDQDITQMKSLERSLEATKANLEAIINQMPAGVVIAEGPSGKIINCNNEFRKMFSANMEMPTSIESYTRWGMLNPDGMMPLSAEEYPMAIALRERRTVSGFQTAIRKPNGDLITILSSASPVKGKEGKVIGAVAIFTDISHQKDREKRLEQQTRDLAKFNADLQRFAYVTSNELRESLKSITNYLNLIEKNSS